MFAARQRTGPVAGFLLSVVIAGLLLLTATADLFVESKVSEDRAPTFTVRIPSVGLYTDTITGGASYRYDRVRKPRGVAVPPQELRLIRAYEDQRRPPSPALLGGLGLAFFLIFLFYTTQLRILGGPTALLRTQLVLTINLLVLAVGSKVFLVLSPWSAMWLPLVALIIPVARGLGARAAAATSVAGAMTLCLLTPIDLPLLVVLTAQGIAAGLAAAGRASALAPLRAALASALSGGLAFAAVSLVLRQFVPMVTAFQQPQDLLALLDSDLAGAAGGGITGGMLALVTTPLILRTLGVVSRTKLFALAEFENPLLKQIATRTPGTWAHSLAMANMAEMASNAIRADGLLVRVGAYYHDLGKSVQPEYYIENQDGKNPHDGLAPDVSADAIFSHVTEGVKLARKHKLPEAVVEFIYTHHGNGLLEYFWHKNMAAGNSKGLTEQDFSYPGVPPQRAETAILALCDAVEAASRTLKDPDNDKIRQLVRQIVFTKLEQGMLNDSGLTIPELQRIAQSLVDTLRSSFHVRVKYPWQRDEEARETSASAAKAPTAAAGETALPASTPQAVVEPAGVAPSEEVIPLAAKKGSKPVELSVEDPAWARPGSAERPRMTTMPLGARRGSEDPTGPSRK